MKYSYDLGQKQFDALLAILSQDREEAGQKYEHIRHGLIRFFDVKSCGDPQGLADETINRGALKLHTLDASGAVQPSSYFYGFAVNVLKEYQRKAGRESPTSGHELDLQAVAQGENVEETRHACLEHCLQEVPHYDKTLVMDYYSLDRIEKIRLRQQLCERLNCTPAALYTRISRIRSSLKKCIEDCMQNGKM